jgi:uncharacterized SAM-binding protein YcdF (DUF218 family)
MIYLNKILPVICLPVGLTVVLVGAGLILRKRVLCWIGLGLLLLLSTGFVSGKLMRWIEGVEDRSAIQDVQTADAIVVLSGMIEERKNAPLGEWSGAVDRFEGGVELFKAGRAPLLIFTGGWVSWKPNAKPEGEILAQRAVNAGVPKNTILVTGRVQNTEEEAIAVSQLCSRKLVVGRKPRIILVTSAFHMRRAGMLFRKNGFEVTPFPVDLQTSENSGITIFSFLPSAQALARSETVIREMIGLAYYWVLGR